MWDDYIKDYTTGIRKANRIRRQVTSINEQIVALHEELQELRQKCPHPNLVVEHKGNTGNWDPNDNRYWTENSCPDCGKQWNQPT
jgi:transposase-like protein